MKDPVTGNDREPDSRLGWPEEFRSLWAALPPLTRSLAERLASRSRLSPTTFEGQIKKRYLAELAGDSLERYALAYHLEGGRVTSRCGECHPDADVPLETACVHSLAGLSHILNRGEWGFPALNKPSLAALPEPDTKPPTTRFARVSIAGLFLVISGSDWGFILRTGPRSGLTEPAFLDMSSRIRQPGGTSRPESRILIPFLSHFEMDRVWETPNGRFPIFFPKEGGRWETFISEGLLPVYRPGKESPMSFHPSGAHWTFEAEWTGEGEDKIFRALWRDGVREIPGEKADYLEKNEIRVLATAEAIFGLGAFSGMPTGFRSFLEKSSSEMRRPMLEWIDELLYASSVDSHAIRLKVDGKPVSECVQSLDRWTARMDIRQSEARGLRLFPHLVAGSARIPLFGPERNLIPETGILPDTGRVTLFRRDRQKELQMRNTVERLMKRGSTEAWISLPPEQTRIFWSTIWPELERSGFERGDVSSEDGEILPGPIRFSLRLSLAGGNSVKASGSAVVSGRTFPLPTIEGDPPDLLVRLDGENRTFLDSQALEILDTLRGLFQLDKNGEGTIGTHAAAMIALHRPDLPLEIDPSLRSRLRPFRPDPLEVAAERVLGERFKGELRSYQKEGIAWLESLHRHGLPGILADEMGLGKTIVVLCFLALRRTDEPGGPPVLVVLPASLVYNWEREILRFLPGLGYRIYHGPGRKEDPSDESADLWITTYGTVRNDREILRLKRFSIVVLDEAQAIKNPDSGLFQAVCDLDAAFRLVMTGTPIENRLGDLWSLFHFLIPGLLGTRRFFEERYVHGKGAGGWSERRLPWLKALVSPLILRRTKEGVLKDLPPKQYVDHWVVPTEEERLQYRSLLEEGREGLKRARRDDAPNLRMNILALLLRLRLFCCHPDLVLGSGQTKVPQPAKFHAAFEKIREALSEDHRILLFSQFVGMLDIIGERLEKEGVGYLRLDGQTSLSERKRRVEWFQSDDPARPPVFLSSLKAGGVGLTLTSADFVFHYDPWWNPQVENQATDRAHRLGQEKSVMVYRFVTRGTVEEKVMALKNEKIALFDRMMDDGVDGMSGTPWLMEQLERLLDPD
jgi:superfamily II DNA or RNA helicase